MKFKVGDRVVFIGDNEYYEKSVATVIGFSRANGYLKVRHDEYDYELESSPDNCHSSYTESYFELEEIVNSPLYKALNEEQE